MTLKRVWASDEVWDEVEVSLALFDVIGKGREHWSYDADFILQARSVQELLREELSTKQLEQLDLIDAHWKSNPKAFNAFFEVEHNRRELKSELTGWLEDEKGDVPAIPQGHWWWRPLGEEE